MKKFILLIIFIGASGRSDTKKHSNSAKHSKDVEELCQSIATFSENTMEARQNGAAMGDILDKLNGAVIDSSLEETRSLMKSLVRDAYAAPLRHTQSGKSEIISEFKNQAHLECLNAMD